MKYSDADAKRILAEVWPERTRTWSTSKGAWWMRARPKIGKAGCPFLRIAGSIVMSNVPDGLWIYVHDTHADVVAVESCGSIPNLADKRSRYAPSTSAMVLQIPRGWLAEPILVQNGGVAPRWKASGWFSERPDRDFAVPVGNLRLLVALDDVNYAKIVGAFPPAAHEFYLRHSSLASYNAKPMQRFLRHMKPGGHFYSGL